MDTFTVMLGFTTLCFIFLGEYKNVGAYLWIAGLFMILFSLRMGEPGFYIVSAAVVGVLFVRANLEGEDSRETDAEGIDG